MTHNNMRVLPQIIRRNYGLNANPAGKVHDRYNPTHRQSTYLRDMERPASGFEEPDFPETPLQVPCGTVDAGEDILAAAYRESAEETGLLYDDGMIHLETVDYDYPEQGQTERHRRHCFHLRLRNAVPETSITTKCRPATEAPRFCSGCSGSTD